MSIRIMSQVWESGPDKQGHLLVLLALADYSNDEGICWPSIKSVAKKARMTERGVQKIVRILEAEGWVEIATGGGRKGCNEYTVNPERRSGGEQGSGVNKDAETPNKDAETLNGGSPEPSRTIKEPSVIKTRKARAVQIDPDAVLSERMVTSASRRGHSLQEAEAQFQRFKTSAIAKGRTYVNWDAAYETWLDSPYFKVINGDAHGKPASKSKARMDAFIRGARGS